MPSTLSKFCQNCGHAATDLESTACSNCGSAHLTSEPTHATLGPVLRVFLGVVAGAAVEALCLFGGLLEVLSGFKPHQPTHFVEIAFAPALLTLSSRPTPGSVFTALGVVLLLLQFPIYGFALARPESSRRRVQVLACILAVHAVAALIVINLGLW